MLCNKSLMFWRQIRQGNLHLFLAVNGLLVAVGCTRLSAFLTVVFLATKPASWQRATIRLRALISHIQFPLWPSLSRCTYFLPLLLPLLGLFINLTLIMLFYMAFLMKKYSCFLLRVILQLNLVRFVAFVLSLWSPTSVSAMEL